MPSCVEINAESPASEAMVHRARPVVLPMATHTAARVDRAPRRIICTTSGPGEAMAANHTPIRVTRAPIAT